MALSVARDALAQLSSPIIVRTNPIESSLLASATILVEELALKLGQPGAPERDISDALASIRELGQKSVYLEWAPHLEKRLREYGGPSAV